MLPRMAWPFVVRKCLSCGKGEPERRHRARGLCNPCHRFNQANGTLDKYREIPDDLQDGKLAKLKTDPRRYVISVLGKTYADRFDDDTVGAEALRIFKVTRDRWYRRTAYIEDPRPSAVEYVYTQALDTIDYLNRDAEDTDVEVDDSPIITFRKMWDVPVAAVSRKYPELGEPKTEEEPDAWVVTWGCDYKFLKLRVPKGDKLRAEVIYQYELIESAVAPYTQAKLLKLAYALANPPEYNPSELDDLL